MTEPRDVFLYPPTGIGEPAPAGHDADPLLANTAESFRNLPWLPNVDLVRFVDEDGRQEWLGWNPAARDLGSLGRPPSPLPRRPDDVLDPAGFTDPADAPAAVHRLTSDGNEPVEMDERHDPNADLDIDAQVTADDIAQPAEERYEPIAFADLDL